MLVVLPRQVRRTTHSNPQHRLLHQWKRLAEQIIGAQTASLCQLRPWVQDGQIWGRQYLCSAGTLSFLLQRPSRHRHQFTSAAGVLPTALGHCSFTGRPPFVANWSYFGGCRHGHNLVVVGRNIFCRIRNELPCQRLWLLWSCAGFLRQLSVQFGFCSMLTQAACVVCNREQCLEMVYSNGIIN